MFTEALCAIAEIFATLLYSSKFESYVKSNWKVRVRAFGENPTVIVMFFPISAELGPEIVAFRSTAATVCGKKIPITKTSISVMVAIFFIILFFLITQSSSPKVITLEK
ncbi:MAG: hypothetical protein M0P44_00660 [Clostridiales bacterium]|nr:hypothetical protein [Clostridiales bacterium]